MKDLLSFQQKLKQILWRLLQLSHSFPSFKCKQIFAAFSFEREVNWHQTFLMTTSCHWSQTLFNFVWVCVRKVMHLCKAYQPAWSLLPGGVGSCLQRSLAVPGRAWQGKCMGCAAPRGLCVGLPLPRPPHSMPSYFFSKICGDCMLQFLVLLGLQCLLM